MRTLSSVLDKCVAGLKQAGQRHYNVEASIALHYLISGPTEEQIEKIETLIQVVDAEMPWREEPNPISREVPKSISFIYHAVVHHNWNTPEIVVWFHIRPGVDCLRSVQVPAYEKYVVELAKRLKSRELYGLSEIHTVVQTSRVTYI